MLSDKLQRYISKMNRQTDWRKIKTFRTTYVTLEKIVKPFTRESTNPESSLLKPTKSRPNNSAKLLRSTYQQKLDKNI